MRWARESRPSETICYGLLLLPLLLPLLLLLLALTLPSFHRRRRRHRRRHSFLAVPRAERCVPPSPLAGPEGEERYIGGGEGPEGGRDSEGAEKRGGVYIYEYIGDRGLNSWGGTQYDGGLNVEACVYRQ